MIRLFVGLGNPGPQYDDTRHNAGFWYIDALARRLGVTLQPDRAYHGLMARANTPQGPVWLLQPQTFMNLSGKSVSALARFFKVEPAEVLVAHDELDLLPGQVKLKLGGGHAGHNGLRDIHAQLGDPGYWRLRLGIGHPGVKSEVAAYVLRKPPAAEREAIEKCISQALDATDQFLQGDMPAATHKVHAQPARPKPPKPPQTPTQQTSSQAAQPDAPLAPPAPKPDTSL